MPVPDSTYVPQLSTLLLNEEYEIPHDALPGFVEPATKKRNLIIGLTESGGLLIQNKSVYQQHIIEFNRHSWSTDKAGLPDKVDWLCRISEYDKGQPLGTPRVISITKLVHLLLNITDDEIADIVNRIDLTAIK